MPINFFSLPGETRNKIYEELLVLSEPIILEIASDHSHDLYKVLPAGNSHTPGRFCLALLLANKRVHSEASQLLYSRNRFRLQDPVSMAGYKIQVEILTSFLDHIGRQNASFLRHICIAFPAFDGHFFESVTLEEDSIRTLELIRDNCTNIATLETSLQTTTRVELALDVLDNPRAVAKVLALVDARFKAISSLKEVIVNVYDEPPINDLRKKMSNYGWTIEVTESGGVDSADDCYDDYYIDYYNNY
jgi:hypothetical protein